MLEESLAPHTPNDPCLICEHHHKEPRYQGIRCSGFRQGLYVYCQREFSPEQNNSRGLFRHYLKGVCRCGVSHDVDVQDLTPVKRKLSKEESLDIAYNLWDDAQPIKFSLAHYYFIGRWLFNVGDIDDNYLRFKEEIWCSEIKRMLPGIIAPIRKYTYQNEKHSLEFVGCQVTFLDGNQKAELNQPRITYGIPSGGAVQLSAFSGNRLGLTEGLEDALAVRELLHLEGQEFPVWATMGTSFYPSVSLPPPDIIQELILFADNDPDGLEAMNKATQSYRSQGYSVRQVPPDDKKDWNNELIAHLEEGENVRKETQGYEPVTTS